MKVLVTGAAGYIGSVLVRQLLKQGKEVLAVDKLMFGGESLIGVYNDPLFSFVKADITDVQSMKPLLEAADAVVHLAAIVGDPACAQQPELANAVNWEGSKKLLELCSQTPGVKRFIFASTCSNYGKMEGDDFITEESPMRPVSLYAELKVKFENHLLNTEFRDDLCVTALRFATVYGLSPRIRFDLTVNEFTRDVALGRELVIFGEQFWRPYCHVEDLARACIHVLDAEPSQVNKNVFNVGDTLENYQKKMLAEELAKLIPTMKVKYVQKNEDPRDYRVAFEKIKNTLGFQISKKVPDGMREIISILGDGIIADPDSPKYKNT
ncbi:MAG: NAD(P)-dependent oxidoreductase [Candidatus Cloacimonadaceae bacterium]|jgi:nucleoside-diphosphate-sugar epimerase|nr:NAD(P)-dependent oxidoreductase [Candidatus Cloacimonadota bacterium]MDX9948954.1 NAD(P)-dependent oxidoreductase [Candidatus Syntrophosphaera sp.]